MKSTTRAALILALVMYGIPVQAQIDRPDGPLMRAVHRDAARLGMAPPQANTAQDWSRVSSLRPGTPIRLEAPGLADTDHHFVLADQLELIVLDLANPALPDPVRRSLLKMATDHPEYFPLVFTGSRFVQDDVRVGPEGVLLRDRKLVEIAQIVKRIPRTDVVAITTPMKRRGSVIGAVAGAGGGLLLGYVSALHLAFKQCGRGCGDERALMALSLVGLPIAGGLLGYQAGTRTTERVIYRSEP